MPSTYTPIATTTLGSAASSVTFSSISGSYTDLILVMNIMRPSGGGNPYIRMTVNNDTANNYSFTYLLGDGSAASSGRASNTNGLIGSYTLGASTTIPTQVMTSFQNYSNATTNKTTLTRVSDQNAGFVLAYASLWRSISAITRIDIAGIVNDYAAGSTFTLYGVKSA